MSKQVQIALEVYVDLTGRKIGHLILNSEELTGKQDMRALNS